MLTDLREKLSPFYSDIGRPSIDSELMLRMLIGGLSVTASGRLQLRLRPTTQFVLNRLTKREVSLGHIRCSLTMSHKKQDTIDSRDALNDFAFLYALRSCALTNMFCQPLRIFSLRRENCDEALSIEIDEGS